MKFEGGNVENETKLHDWQMDQIARLGFFMCVCGSKDSYLLDKEEHKSVYVFLERRSIYKCRGCNGIQP